MGYVSLSAVKKAVSKAKFFNEFYKEFMDRMKAFEREKGYYTEVSVRLLLTELTFKASLERKEVTEIFGTRISDLKVNECKLYLDMTISFQTNYEVPIRTVLLNSISEIIYKNIPLNKLNVYDWQRVQSLEIGCHYWHIKSQYAWNKEVSGIYWIEQECGEHWIIIPNKVSRETSIFIAL